MRETAKIKSSSVTFRFLGASLQGYGYIRFLTEVLHPYRFRPDERFRGERPGVPPVWRSSVDQTSRLLSIADEKSDVPLVVVEIQRCEVRNVFVHVYAYWEFHPGGWPARARKSANATNHTRVKAPNPRESVMVDTRIF